MKEGDKENEQIKDGTKNKRGEKSQEKAKQEQVGKKTITKSREIRTAGKQKQERTRVAPRCQIHQAFLSLEQWRLVELGGNLANPQNTWAGRGPCGVLKMIIRLKSETENIIWLSCLVHDSRFWCETSWVQFPEQPCCCAPHSFTVYYAKNF